MRAQAVAWTAPHSGQQVADFIEHFRHAERHDHQRVVEAEVGDAAQTVAGLGLADRPVSSWRGRSADARADRDASR
jgi:hypothetical protein